MPKVTVKVPTPLRAFTAGQSEVAVEGSTVGALVRELANAHPELRRHLYGPEGRLRSFVVVYLNDQDVRYLDREATVVRDGDIVSIVPAIAGGAPASAPPMARAADGSLPKGPSERFSPEELRRYSRHLLLPEVGIAGQKRLQRAKVLLVGAGGLGSPAALYLTAAGVGEIGLVDFDRVDVTNLQRQVLYTTADIGRPKLEAAQERLEALNPGVRIVRHEERLTSVNALDVLRPYDVVVDGTDNFPTRYLVNDAAVLLGKPNVYGSIYRFEGQVSVFDARQGPCYRCLYPEPPPPDLVPSCAEGGVLGVLPGIIGVLQATETVKLLLGQGQPLLGRLLLFDALSLQFRELQLRKNPECVLCGAHATQKGLVDYPAFCGVPGLDEESVGRSVPSIEPEALATTLRSPDPPLLVDVREPMEWELSSFPGALRIPRGELTERLDELTRAREVVLICSVGTRSAYAVRTLLDLGFQNVKNLRGGIRAWAEHVDPSVLTY